MGGVPPSSKRSQCSFLLGNSQETVQLEKLFDKIQACVHDKTKQRKPFQYEKELHLINDI